MDLIDLISRPKKTLDNSTMVILSCFLRIKEGLKNYVIELEKKDYNFQLFREESY